MGPAGATPQPLFGKVMADLPSARMTAVHFNGFARGVFATRIDACGGED